MIWAFVDYENTGSIAGFNAADYARIFVFCGPNHNKLKFGEMPSTEFSRIELIALTTTGANNLDFHLAFYLGRLHESAEAVVEFHIISNDNGFNGLVSHLKKIGRKCKRISPKRKNRKTTTNANKNNKALSACATLVIARLRKMDLKKRPTKKTKLINWLKSQCGHLEPKVSPENVFEELTQSGNIRIVASGIKYDLKC